MILVTVYGMVGCGGCDVLKAQLTKAGISFKSKDVLDSDTSLDVNRLGIRGIPHTTVESKGAIIESIYGSTKSVVDRIVELAKED